MTQAARPGDVLAGRYLLVDLLSESGNGRFWRAHDNVLDRHVALHCIAGDDERAAGLTEAARLSATVPDRRLLRVLDADERDGISYVVNEWGSGTSLDILVTNEGPLPPRRAAWIVSEVAASTATAHAQRVAHGRLIPENVLIDHSGAVKVIGCCVDAALHGLPAGRISSDVTDLGGLLYFALTGKWAGASGSQMPAAPQVQGRWLRPRQVRAGIPRVLDAICDEVLNPFAATPSDTGHNLHTAGGLAGALQDYVGDPIGMAAVTGPGGAGVLAVPERRTPERTAPPDPEATRAMPSPAPPDPPGGAEPESPHVAATEPSTEAPLEAPPEAPTEQVTAAPAEPEPADEPGEQPTEAGMPVFDDEGDDVNWFRARHQPPPPPPPLEEPPARPLFAPDPSDGGPTRRPRPGAAGTGQPDYWPWDTATGAGTGSGVIPVTEDADGDDEVPGRSWFRLAALLGTSLLLLIAVVVAFNLGRGKSPLGTDPEPESPSPSDTQSTPAVQPIEVVSARDFDPQGDPPAENPDLAALAVDGDPSTAWETQTYFDQLAPGFKTGVGLVVDLGESQEVSQVDVTTLGSPLNLSYYVTDDDPTAVAGLEPAASGRVTDDRLRTTFDEPATGRFLIVWLTRLPPVGGDSFQAAIAEVGVRG